MQDITLMCLSVGFVCLCVCLRKPYDLGSFHLLLKQSYSKVQAIKYLSMSFIIRLLYCSTVFRMNTKWQLYSYDEIPNTESISSFISFISFIDGDIRCEEQTQPDISAQLN